MSDTDTSPLTKLAKAAALLGDAPLRPRQRATVFRAIAELPGLTYLGETRDPLGRPGVAVAAEGSPRAANVNTPQRYRLELIFDPSTGTVLGMRTVALKGVQVPANRAEGVPGAILVRAGQLMFSWVYVRAGVVEAMGLPSLVCSHATHSSGCGAIVSKSINKHGVRPAPAQPPKTSSSEKSVAAEIKLSAPGHRQTPTGIAEILREGTRYGTTIKQYGLAINATGLIPNTSRNGYAVWLAGGRHHSVLLGFVSPPSAPAIDSRPPAAFQLTPQAIDAS